MSFIMGTMTSDTPILPPLTPRHHTVDRKPTDPSFLAYHALMGLTEPSTPNTHPHSIRISLSTRSSHFGESCCQDLPCVPFPAASGQTCSKSKTVENTRSNRDDIHLACSKTNTKESKRKQQGRNLISLQQLKHEENMESNKSEI